MDYHQALVFLFIGEVILQLAVMNRTSGDRDNANLHDQIGTSSIVAMEVVSIMTDIANQLKLLILMQKILMQNLNQISFEWNNTNSKLS